MKKMDRNKRSFWAEKLLWTAMVLHIAMVTAVGDASSEEPQQTTGNGVAGWTWSIWGSWTPCSKSCGGGVSVQSRQCVPRGNADTNSTAQLGTQSPLLDALRPVANSEECEGPSRRYHECNTAPCSGGPKDARAEQCSAYDRRPFRGRYYTWVPYVDGDAPCTLNCRPTGQQFYASLAVAADGTPCTSPGFRAICVQGVCKVVGREGVLGSGAGREARCGRRLVSGLFARPRLPLGYSLVATVPRGACRLNVTELQPTDNYIALKVTNSSYIVNGEFAVSAPGTYEAAGARFLYTRVANLDSVFAHGPIQHPIDIMILYTQPIPSIKYEYFTESMPGESDIEAGPRTNIPEPVAPTTVPPKHTRRHHSFRPHARVSVDGNSPRYPDVAMSEEASQEKDEEDNFVHSRKFMWKILSFSQCTRTCGGGFQVGRFRCVETDSNGSDREVSLIHCTGSAPASRRKRCGLGLCPPRWRSAAWTGCPACGPATRTRIVGCVQDHSKGITKVSDQKCPAPKPDAVDVCNIPNCDGQVNKSTTPREPKQFDSKRIVRPREETDTFREGPVYTVSVNGSDDLGPEYSFSVVGGWLYTDWSECVGWCVGGGMQTRAVKCADPAGCAPRRAPDVTKTCSPIVSCEPYDGQWFTGDWSPCSGSCGGKQMRGVLCIGGSGRHLRDSACKGSRPNHERDCGDECIPSWFFSDWSQCAGNCQQGKGIQRRTVWCARSDNSVPSEAECFGARPPAQKVCKLERCATGSKAAPELSIESQRIARNEISNTIESKKIKTIVAKECEDQLGNCALAVQARLCHYKYYIQNCCNSCYGR